MWLGLQVVLKRARNVDEISTEVHDKITEFASRGFRSLGVAMAEGSSGDRYVEFG
jgi:H+-transporting ATPase